jgi:LacI family transcriptional regulator
MFPTVLTLAKVTGLSRGTVDRVLNGRPGASPEARERVLAAAATLGYKPNLIGKSLALQKKPLRIGFILVDSHDPLFLEMREGMEAAAAELASFAVRVDCRVMARISAAEQVRCIRALSRGRLAGLALAPLDDPKVAEELDRVVRTTGIPVATYNFDPHPEQRLCFVGPDLRKSGRVAAGLLAQLLHGRGTVLVVYGQADVAANRGRLEGFREEVDLRHPGLRILRTVPEILGDEDAYRAVSACLAQYPRPDAIYITSHGTGGVARALREAGAQSTRVACYDLRPDVEALLREGIVDFTLTQEPFMQGYQPVRVLFDYLFNGRQPADRFLQTRIAIITRELL